MQRKSDRQNAKQLRIGNFDLTVAVGDGRIDDSQPIRSGMTLPLHKSPWIKAGRRSTPPSSSGSERPGAPDAVAVQVSGGLSAQPAQFADGFGIRHRTGANLLPSG